MLYWLSLYWAMQGQTALWPPGVGGLHEAPSHTGLHTSCSILFIFIYLLFLFSKKLFNRYKNKIQDYTPLGGGTQIIERAPISLPSGFSLQVQEREKSKSCWASCTEMVWFDFMKDLPKFWQKVSRKFTLYMSIVEFEMLSMLAILATSWKV